MAAYVVVEIDIRDAATCSWTRTPVIHGRTVRELEIFGRIFVATLAEDGWAIHYPGAEGKRGPRFEIPIPHDVVSPEELRRYLADLCHEWASPRHPDVRWRS